LSGLNISRNNKDQKRVCIVKNIGSVNKNVNKYNINITIKQYIWYNIIIL